MNLLFRWRCTKGGWWLRPSSWNPDQPFNLRMLGSVITDAANSCGYAARVRAWGGWHMLGYFEDPKEARLAVAAGAREYLIEEGARMLARPRPE